MSVGTRQPLLMAGASLNSGGPRTGEFSFIRGGSLRGTIIASGGTSGVVLANHVLSGNLATVYADRTILFSGAGRLNSVLVHNQLQSGQGILFLDGATSGVGSGPGISGQIVIGRVPATWEQGLTVPPSGNPTVPYTAFAGQQGTYLYDTPFTSGLTVVTPSGSPNITVFWSPEIIPINVFAT